MSDRLVAIAKDAAAATPSLFGVLACCCVGSTPWPWESESTFCLLAIGLSPFCSHSSCMCVASLSCLCCNLILAGHDIPSHRLLHFRAVLARASLFCRCYKLHVQVSSAQARQRRLRLVQSFWPCAKALTSSSAGWGEVSVVVQCHKQVCSV